MSSKVSFTVRPPPRSLDTDDTPQTSRPGSASPDSDGLRLPHRPTTSSPLVPNPNSSSSRNGKTSGKRQWASYTGPDSSDEEEADTAEIITGFDAMGVQRLDESKNKPKGPLVIAAQKNRDWGAESMARKRQARNGFVPDGARVAKGKDGSQGGLGTRGTINDGPQLSGLIVKVKEEGNVKVEEDVEMQDEEVGDAKEGVKEEVMDEDQRALRALLRGDQGEEKRMEIAAIRMEDQAAWHQPKTEADAFREDVLTRPDEATLEDYERIPIELFGEAMLRGMGHAPGKAASRTGAGRVDPYIPESRPALLGIGAKPRPVDQDADKNSKKKFTRPDKRYVPIVKIERTNSGSAVSSRRTSRSRSGSPPRERKKEREREPDRDRTRDRERDRDSYRERDRERDDRKRERGYDSERRAEERPREKDQDRERRRDYESDRDYERRRDGNREKDTDRRRDRGDDRRDRRR